MKLFGYEIKRASGKLPAMTYSRDAAGNHIYKLTDHDLGEFKSCFSGGYSEANMIALFESIPEVFAPIDAIASRVTNGIFQLKRIKNDEIVYDNKAFNRLTSKPNWKQTWAKYVYNAVVYKYACGNRYFHGYVPSTLKRNLDNTSALWLLPPQYTEPVSNLLQPEAFKSLSAKDVVKEYKYNPGYGARRILTPDEVFHDTFLQFSLINNNPLLGMGIIRVNEYPASNLIAVYEARNVIYVKRGALGMIVSKKSDESGNVPLTFGEKKQIRDEYQSTYGVGAGKHPVGIAEAPVDFVRMAMSIEELMPFEETYACAAALCVTSGVPRSFIPTKEAPTYNNGPADERKLYQDVVIKNGQEICTIHDEMLGLTAAGLYMDVSYAHIAALQDDKKVEADTREVTARTNATMYEKNFITKNQFLVSVGMEEIKGGDVYASDARNSDPLAVRLGVGGTQALQGVLLAPLPPEVKKQALIIVFGIAEADAKKLVSNEQIITPTGTGA